MRREVPASREGRQAGRLGWRGAGVGGQPGVCLGVQVKTLPL